MSGALAIESLFDDELSAQASSSVRLGLHGFVGRETELARLAELLATVRDGQSAAMLLRGEPGVGKSALLEQLVGLAAGFQVVRAVGVEGEVDLPYAGLHQLCRSMLDTIGALPEPQSEALRVSFGLSAGDAADRYLVGLAVLTLMSEIAATQPLLCVVDDAQWLDPATAQALAFVARRLGAESVGLVIASRGSVDGLDGIPELQLSGLSSADARLLLDSVLAGRLDGPVRERFLTETRGNPLALIELPRSLTPAEAATGILHHSGGSLSSRIEDSFRRRLEPLSAEARQLLLLAAADPLGDPLLLLRAAAHLGLGVEAADAAEETGLLQLRERCSFRHPLVRAAVYSAATQRERRRAHGALAEATDAEIDPDRKAWHRAQATAAPDEDIATELECTAARAQSRGGLAAAGAFLERAVMLTPDASRRAERALAAAEVMFEAGAFNAVENLLRVVDSAQLDELRAARAERLHAQVSLSHGRDKKGAILRLLAAAERLRQLDPRLGQTAHLEALRTAFYLASPDVLCDIAGALNRSPASESGAIVELILRGWAHMLEHGYPAGTELLREAMVSLRDKPHVDEAELPLLYFSEGIARSLWDFDSWEALARRTAGLARDSGALSMLARALGWWADVKVAAGELPLAATALAEADALADTIGLNADWLTGAFDAVHYEEPEALARIDLHERNTCFLLPWFDYARAVVYNAAGRYELALEAAQRACDRHPLGTCSWALVELVEAAMRSGHKERANLAFEQLVERTRLGGTEWSLGLEARCAALRQDDPAVGEPLYREAVERLGRARTRPDLARAHLVYGEWLRREGRRVDAREQLRTAHDLFIAMGMPGFAERARRELTATGETARKRTDETRADLTAQEAQIARLAAEGLTNSEIGAQLFLSPRTVEWHLRRVYPKLGIGSRKELRVVLHSV